MSVSKSEEVRLLALEAQTIAEWRARGEDRHRWPWAPVGLLAILAAEGIKAVQRTGESFSYWLDEGRLSPTLHLWRFGKRVWPLCPFCGYPLVRDIERHSCK